MRHRCISYTSNARAVECRWYSEDDEVPDRIEVDGVVYSRETPGAGRGEGLQIIPDEKPMVSNSSPRWHGVAVGNGKGFYDSYTPDGKPIIGGRAARREANARASWYGESINRVRDLE